MNKKKVFITIDWFDPAYKAGGPVISIVKLIENLNEYFDFYVLTGSVDYGDTDILAGIQTNTWMDWKGKAQVYYLSEENRSRKKVFEILDAANADIYYVQGIFSLYFSIFPLIWWHQAKEDKLIVATRGMFHASALRVKRVKKMFYLYAAKLMGWFHHVTFHSTNREETTQLKKILGNEANYAEASNFPRVMNYKKAGYVKEKDSLKLLSVARISPEKNTLFLLEVLSNVGYDITLTIVGNYADESYYQQFEKKRMQLPANVTVNYEGHKLINELENYYHMNDVFILPTTGENFGHSIIEALSAGMPSIISKNTTWNNLENKGAGFNLEEETAAYLSAIETYYKMDNSEFAEACKKAREYAESSINLQQTKEAYLKLLS